MNLYLDTSALVKLYVEEAGSAAVRETVTDAETVATSVVAYVEARSAFARRHREKRLSRTDYRRTVREFEADWDHYLLVEVTIQIVRRGAELAEDHALRAYDAIHLASAELLRGRVDGNILFASWDSTLMDAARRQGFGLVRIR